MSTLLPRAIEVEGLRKHFTVPAPGGEPPSALSRVVHPVRHGARRTLRVLDGITFEVAKGEMFGIIGRNGSGKTTLLRILGSIYRPDAGRVRLAGTVAPFIDLGVGFQPQMSARQNVAINGVMLGLGRGETRRRVDEVLDYAELRDFADVQLKYFSSGMRGRLAFASMRQTDPDVYLLDEILASGDEEFREKTGGEFAALNKRGKTIVLVTHGRGAIEELAHRAMWLHEGKIGAIGEPKEVLGAYRAERLARTGKASDEAESKPGDEDRPGKAARTRPPRATIETLVLENGAGAELSALAAGEPIRLLVEAKASGWVKAPTLELAIVSEDGVRVFASRDADIDRLPALKPGEGLVAEATLENSLGAGRYRLECTIAHGDDRGGAVSPTRSIAFDVDGVAREGVVALERSVVLRPATSLEPIR